MFHMFHICTVRNSAHIGCWGSLVLVFFWGFVAFGGCFVLVLWFSRFSPLSNMQSFQPSHDALGTRPHGVRLVQKRRGLRGGLRGASLKVEGLGAKGGLRQRLKVFGRTGALEGWLKGGLEGGLKEGGFKGVAEGMV